MFHRRLNELRLTFHLCPKTPLLIKAGEDPQSTPANNEPGNQQPAAFVRTRRNGTEEPYLPGRSLKGVLRNYCEQLIATFYSTANVCDPFDLDGKTSGKSACTKKVEAMQEFGARYKAACSICKLFGCGGLAGRLAFSDAYLTVPLSEIRFGRRSGVGINRQRGAAETAALFFYEVLEQGRFALTVTLENFELWQLGLTALALDELRQGRLPVGYGTHRAGMGLLTGEIQCATLSYFGVDAHPTQGGCQVRGVRSLTPDPLANTYGWAEETSAGDLQGAKLTKLGLRQQWELQPDALAPLWRAGIDACLQRWGFPQPETQA